MKIRYQKHYIKLNNPCRNEQHVHEIQGSVEIAGSKNKPHNHRFATISGEAVIVGLDHYHKVIFRTDYDDNHYHEFYGKTTGVIPVGDRHIHFLEKVTTEKNGHQHHFRFATLIDNPIQKED